MSVLDLNAPLRKRWGTQRRNLTISLTERIGVRCKSSGKKQGPGDAWALPSLRLSSTDYAVNTLAAVSTTLRIFA